MPFSSSSEEGKNTGHLGLARLDEKKEGTFFFDDNLTIEETIAGPVNEMEKTDAEEIQRRIDSLREYIHRQGSEQ